jgi:hypothetical protein
MSNTVTRSVTWSSISRSCNTRTVTEFDLYALVGLRYAPTFVHNPLPRFAPTSGHCVFFVLTSWMALAAAGGCSARGTTNLNSSDVQSSEITLPKLDATSLDIATVVDVPSVLDVVVQVDVSPVVEDRSLPPVDRPVVTCAATVPTDGFCASEGTTCRYAPPMLTSCEAGLPYDFYGSEYCNAAATVVVMCAGWDAVCQRGATMIESQITTAYTTQGVRSLVALVENASRQPATLDFCRMWRSRFFAATPTYFTTASELSRSVNYVASPTFAIIDRRGRLRSVVIGLSPNTVRTAIERLLAERL